MLLVLASESEVHHSASGQLLAQVLHLLPHSQVLVQQRVVGLGHLLQLFAVLLLLFSQLLAQVQNLESKAIHNMKESNQKQVNTVKCSTNIIATSSLAASSSFPLRDWISTSLSDFSKVEMARMFACKT